MKSIEDSYTPEDREKDLAALQFLRDQITEISFKDGDTRNLLYTGHQRHKRVLSSEQINTLIIDLNEAIRDVKAGFPISLQRNSLQSLTDSVNDLRNILIDNNILKKDETL